MEFFIPFAKDNAQAERVYSAFKLHPIITSEVDDRRIYAIGYIHNGQEYVAAVGEQLSFLKETVLAIISLKDNEIFFVFTPNRGTGRDYGPLLVGKHAIRGDIRYFD